MNKDELLSEIEKLKEVSQKEIDVVNQLQANLRQAESALLRTDGAIRYLLQKLEEIKD